MNTYRKLSWILGICLLLLVVAGVFVLGTIQTGADPCGPNWGYLPSAADRERCAQAKMTRVAQEEERESRAKQTAQVVHPYTPSIPNYKPAVLWPRPSEFNKVERIAHPQRREPITSMWLYGAVPTNDYTFWDQYYILSKPGKDNYPILETSVLNIHDESERQYEHTWTCPRAIGTLTITAITKPAGWVEPTPAPVPPHPYPEVVGIVHFTSSSGVAGTFNLATQQWTFTP